jgi:hypothetical protein
MKIILWIVGIVVVLVGGFFVLNSYIYDQKQGDAATLVDGEHTGFIRAFIDNNVALSFDDAQWLTGKEAEDAAIEAGHCTEETRAECLPNPFFIKNASSKEERVPVDESVEVTLQTWKMEETGQITAREVDFAEFAALINDSSLHWRSLPYRLTIANGVVTRIEEIYLP